MLITPVFDFFAEEEKTLAATKKKDDLSNEIKKHWEIMRLCWDEWNGPKVDPDSIDGYCQVHHITAYSITHGENRYHYMAPCRIDSVSEDMMELEVTVDYEEGSTCEHCNGERLKLHILEVWPPVYRINRSYRSNKQIATLALKYND